MKRQLKAIYDNLSQEISSLPLKVEPVFESKGYRKDGYHSRGANNSFRGGRGRIRTGRGESQQNKDWRNQPSDLQKQKPLNSYEKVSRYPVCQSIYHYARDCPYKDFNKSQENNIKLFTQEIQKCFLQKILGETLNLAVLDSGCTKTVCGKEWLKCYVHSPSEEKKHKFQI